MMRKTFSRFSCVMAFALFLATGCGNKGAQDSKNETVISGEGTGAPVKLAFNPEVGKAYVVSMKVDQEINSTVMGQTMNTSQELSFESAMKIREKLDNGNLLVENTYKRIYMHSVVPDMFEMVVDTRDPSRNKGMMVELIAGMLGKMMDKPYINEMTPQGGIVRSDVENVMDDAGLGEMAESIKENQVSSYGVMFPDQDVRVGESWHREISSSASGKKTVIKMQFTLKSISNDEVEVELNGVISSGEGDKTNVISGTQKGIAYVNRKTGITRKVELEQDMSLEVERKGVKMPTDIKGAVVITIE